MPKQKSQIYDLNKIKSLKETVVSIKRELVSSGYYRTILMHSGAVAVEGKGGRLYLVSATSGDIPPVDSFTTLEEGHTLLNRHANIILAWETLEGKLSDLVAGLDSLGPADLV